MKQRFQWVWWGFRKMSWGFVRLDQEVTALAHIYTWTVCLGPLEIRRWRSEP